MVVGCRIHVHLAHDVYFGDIPKRCLGCATLLYLSPLSTDATSQLNVLRHDCDTLGMDSTKVGILEQTDKVSFRGLLKSKDGLSQQMLRRKKIVV